MVLNTDNLNADVSRQTEVDCSMQNNHGFNIFMNDREDVILRILIK